MGVVEAPLVLEKRFQMLGKGWWKPLKLEPFCVGRLESEEITCFAGIVGAVHVGVEKMLRCGGRCSWSSVKM